MLIRLLRWAVIVGAAWVFRVYYNAWPGPWIFACALALPPILFLLSLPSMLGLNIQLEGPSRALRGEKAECRVRFSNSRLLPIHHAAVRLELRNLYTGNAQVESRHLRNLASAGLRLTLPTGECGVLRYRITRCELRDPLGLFAIRRSFDRELLCAVLPEARKAQVNLDAVLDASRVLKPKYGGGFSEEYDLRAYRPGDMTNSIHWKLSSKTDDLIVREALTLQNSAIYLVLDHPGANDEGLGVLRWLSAELIAREEAHILVADSLYPVENARESDGALVSLLSKPMGPPCEFDARTARCVFRVRGEEVCVE